MTAWTRSSLSGKYWYSCEPLTSAAALTSSKKVPATPRSWIREAAFSTIRARVLSPLGVSLGRALVSLAMRPMLATFEFDSPVRPCQSEFRNPFLQERAKQLITDLKDRTALVTGSTSGIGKATAIALAARGARVLVVGRNEQRANDVGGEIGGSGGSATFRLTTLGDLESARELVQGAAEAGGGHVDILINNAGV